MNIGDLDKRLDLEAPIGFGGAEYAPFASGVPANVRMAGGNELLRYGAQAAVAATVITIRHRTDLRADMRIRIPSEDRNFQVTTFGDPDGKRHWMQIDCTELL